jgi:hypothetical protein
MLKKGPNRVRLDGVKPEIIVALIVADQVYHSFNQPLVWTSAKDGKHKTGSKHYSGEAIDIRTNHIPNMDAKLAIVEDIKRRLTEDYDVLFEDDLFDENGKQLKYEHIHIEFDPKETT